MMDNVKIYVCCHKDYENVGITNSCYKLITNKEHINNNSPLELIYTDRTLDDRMWSELSCIYHIWKHPELQADWIGISHYRRYFDFMNNIPTFTKPIIPKVITSMFNNFITYSICHNSNDLVTIMQMIFNGDRKYFDAITATADSHVYYPYNMFVFPKAVFNQLCEFLFKTLLEFDKLIKVNNNYVKMIEHIGINREAYIEKPSYPNNTYEYQARLYGFLAERMTTAFFFKYLNEHGRNSLEEHEVVITEKTYNKI
jgi:hypothetical protein